MCGSYFKMRFAYGSDDSLVYHDPYRLFVGDIAGAPELNCIAIPAGSGASAPQGLNPAEMIREYDLGHRMCLSGIPWRRPPPGYHE